jgi:cytoskeletal protein RodZ
MESVGQYLRQTREAQGKTIDEVAKATRMSRQIIVALEEDRFSVLPAAVYVKGHLRTYARFLGLGEDDIIHKYMRFTQQLEKVEPDEWDAVEMEMHETTRRTGRFWQRVGIIAVVVILIILGIVWGVRRAGHQSTTPQERTPEEQVHEATTQDTLIEWHKLELTVVARERTWVRVSADATPTADLTLNAGDERTWQADERFTLDVGNGGGLELYLDGELLGTAGTGSRLVEGLVVDENGMSH